MIFYLFNNSLVSKYRFDLFIYCRPQLLATGDGTGTVHVFRLSEDLRSSQARENDVLNNLVDIAVEQ